VSRSGERRHPAATAVKSVRLGRPNLTSASGPDRHDEPTLAAVERGGSADLRVDVGILVAHAPGADSGRLRSFATRAAQDAVEELASTTDVTWRFHLDGSARLADHDRRRPSEFLDRATHRMVEGPYDLVVVVTDVPLVSSGERFVPGLASPLARVAVVSTENLRTASRGEPRRSLDDAAVRWNAATLMLHLVGHVLGARHGDAGSVMEPFRFGSERRAVPPFDADVERYLDRIAGEIPAAEARPRGRLARLAFHAHSAVRNPRQILRALRNSRAPLLPFSLPRLSTAALTPTLVIVFSAEAWDVGFHMSDVTAILFAAVSVLAAAIYLQFVQNLTFPRKRHRIVTEHTALVNVTVFLVLLFAMVGLFGLVWGVMLVIELVVFPPNLMSSWPSLEEPVVGFLDLVRTGAFISTVGVLSGALAGGLESRTIVSHLALFPRRP
jgi:predicted Zn-dependent protease/multisubunit Na+/H+ antiporter MnhF subunit